MANDAIIQLENKFYISANSTYADDRVQVLNHIDTFGIFDRWGDILQLGPGVQGLYHEGTRYLSTLEFRICNARPLLLSSAIKEENEIMSVDLTNQLILRDTDPVPKGVLFIGRTKMVRNGSCHERIEFFNYGSEQHNFPVSINFNADFKDIFEIRGMVREKTGSIPIINHPDNNSIQFTYTGLDNIVRETNIKFHENPVAWVNNTQAEFDIRLEPHTGCIIEYSVSTGVNKTNSTHISFLEASEKSLAELKTESNYFPSIITSNGQFNHWINRSRADLISLLAKTPFGRYPYAGVPWYNTAFGRDGIITALQTLWASPGIAKDVLLFLAEHQAKEMDDFSDAEPGKIIHEMRKGEMVETGEIPFKKYYGSVDSTPLFLVLAGAYYNRTGDIDTIARIWENIEAANLWIDEYGDADGDGFIEYHNRSANGLVNQGWKDSYDSVSHEDGTLATGPIALCEVQGYVYDARKQIASLARILGKNDFAEKLESQAVQLRTTFNEKFWDEELKTFVIALDGDKNPCRIVSSNAGHCLFSGIADEHKAGLVVNTLMSADMFNGWGIRTLSRREKRYNPMSYHNGSVWPHDVALIAYGFFRYGYMKDALKLCGALFQASLFLELQRLPELFCGFMRRYGEGPTAYPVACSPQAWSVGAVFLLLKACLHIEIDGVKKRVTFRKPSMPEFINTISLSGLELFEGKKASFEIHRYKEDTGLSVQECPGDWQITVFK
jgi:glycogen debranching enzyme